MQLIKSLRSFGRWLFNIKDEVKAYDVFHDQLSAKVYVTKVSDGGRIIYFRYQNSLKEQCLFRNDFLDNYRKIS